MQATAQLDTKRKELAVHLQKLGVGLGGLRKTLVTRTTDLFDQVTSSQIHIWSVILATHNSAVPHGLQQFCSFPVVKCLNSRAMLLTAGYVFLVSVCGIQFLEGSDALQAAQHCEEVFVDDGCLRLSCASRYKADAGARHSSRGAVSQ